MKTITLLLVAAMLAGCAASKRFVDEPIIDRKGVDMAKYAIDKAESAWIMVLVLARAADMGGSVTDAVNSFM